MDPLLITKRDAAKEAAGKRLSSARVAAQLDQSQLAKAVGMAAPMINMQENGKRTINPAQASDLARVLGVDPWWLLTGELPNNGFKSIAVSGFIDASDVWEPNSFATVDGIKARSVSVPVHQAPSREWLAVEVRGTSMRPMYQPGHIISGPIFTDGFENFIGQPCMIETRNARSVVKFLKRGNQPGHYSLESINPAFPDLQDQQIKRLCPVLATFNSMELN